MRTRAAAVVTAVALVLVGCGSGGDEPLEVLPSPGSEYVIEKDSRPGYHGQVSTYSQTMEALVFRWNDFTFSQQGEFCGNLEDDPRQATALAKDGGLDLDAVWDFNEVKCDLVNPAPEDAQ